MTRYAKDGQFIFDPNMNVDDVTPYAGFKIVARCRLERTSVGRARA
jgi:hypothetical protein